MSVTDATDRRPAGHGPGLAWQLVDEMLSGQGIWPAVPALVALTIVAVIPFGILLSLGFSDLVVSRGEIVSQTPTLRHLAVALADPLYWTTFSRSLTLALSTTACCAVLGFPVAYLFLIGGRTVRRLILVLTIAPILTSGIVRTYAWIVILGGRGLVNGLLLDLGLVSAPLRIINTPNAVLIGMVQIHLPLMILPLIAVMSRHDRRLDEASANLGASRLGTIGRVILPLSLPGLGTGASLVFTLSYTTFVVPQLLGGGNYLNAATMIYEQVVYSLEWSKGAVSATLLMATCLLVLLAITAATNRATRWTRAAAR